METVWTRNVKIYLIGLATTVFGSSLVQYAVVWYIAWTTQSGIMMTLASVSAFAPQLVITLFAGVWADRYDRKKIIIYSDLMIALATLILAIVFLSGYQEIWLLLVIMAIRSLGAGLQMPAATAFVPQFVPQEHLLKVNGAVGMIQAASQLVAPAVSGILFSYAKLEHIFFIDVVTAIIGVAFLVNVLVPPHKRALEKKETGILVDLKMGIQYTMKHEFIKEMLIFYAVFMILIIPAAMLTPIQIPRTFGIEKWRLPAMEISFSAGATIGGYLITVWGGFKNRIKTIASASIVFGVTSILIGVVGNFILYCAIMVIMGLGMPFFNTPSYTMIQENVKEEVLGRVMSVFTIISAATFPIGMIVLGPLADIVSVESLLIVSGILLTLLGWRIFVDKKLKMHKIDTKDKQIENI